MPGGHILVQSLDSIGAGHLAVLLVHVVGAGARVVSDPDTEVLDLGGALLVDLKRFPSAWPCLFSAQTDRTYHVECDDLAIGLLDLPDLRQEVPETRLGDNGVVGEDAHAVQLRGWVGIGGQVAPNDLVFLEAT